MLGAAPLPATPRQRLLEVNGGGWEGLFVCLGPDGREIERFPTRLLVTDQDGTVAVVIVHPPCPPGPVQVSLTWQVDADSRCRIERRYSAYGLLEPLPADG